MLNQLHTAADLAADHRRALQAEADTYRLARTARRATAPSCPRPARARFGLPWPFARRVGDAA